VNGWTQRVSVVVCAYTTRRWDDLQASIESVRAQPEADEVVLVVDHAPELLALARARWDDVVIVENAQRRGLSGARNTGVLEASGDVVAFLDDDAVAEPDWVRLLVEPFVDLDVVGVGGRAEPVWPAGGRRFYSDELLWVVGCSYAGLPEGDADVRNVLGCTMAFRRWDLVQAGGFDLDTGRVGRIPLGCEETQLCIRLRQDDPDARIVLRPAALVQHRVTPDRVTWSYLLRRGFFEGVSKAALSRELGREDSLSTESHYLSRTLPGAVLRELGLVGRGGLRRAAAIVACVAATVAGYVLGTVAGARLGGAGSIAETADLLERAGR
jgi:GT2 family glycosyltransferase